MYLDEICSKSFQVLETIVSSAYSLDDINPNFEVITIYSREMHDQLLGVEQGDSE